MLRLPPHEMNLQRSKAYHLDLSNKTRATLTLDRVTYWLRLLGYSLADGDDHFPV